MDGRSYARAAGGSEIGVSWIKKEVGHGHKQNPRLLYWLARLMGDVSAVQKGKVGRRVTRRLAGKATGKALRKLFR
ncbi:hypothetical protein HKBW3S06_00660 [Candidatus Hakubella thermalkaliphila]|uniref:Uncharacterized protein n=1 Tax=Candidatus Hakubella thermalkaliphila TaxID=2754717 RepID=A0A6V8NMU2_9ACTN|nr:hypothetical protein HKBW3S06_00660 [Candidatus Hakubella thermalkaliphila]